MVMFIRSLHLGRQEKPRRNTMKLLLSAVVCIFSFKIAPAYGQAEKLKEICNQPAEDNKGTESFPVAQDCFVEIYDLTGDDPMLIIEIFNGSEISKVVDEVAPLNFRTLILKFKSEIDLDKYNFNKLKITQRLYLRFFETASLSIENFDGMIKLGNLMITSSKELTISRRNSNKPSGLPILSAIEIEWDGSLKIEDRAFVGLPALEVVSLFGDRIANSKRAAFIGVETINNLPANIDFRESSGGIWD